MHALQGFLPLADAASTLIALSLYLLTLLGNGILNGFQAGFQCLDLRVIHLRFDRLLVDFLLGIVHTAGIHSRLDGLFAQGVKILLQFLDLLLKTAHLLLLLAYRLGVLLGSLGGFLSGFGFLALLLRQLVHLLFQFAHLGLLFVVCLDGAVCLVAFLLGILLGAAGVGYLLVALLDHLVQMLLQLYLVAYVVEFLAALGLLVAQAFHRGLYALALLLGSLHGSLAVGMA